MEWNMVWLRDGLASLGLMSFIVWSFAAAQLAVATLV
jgi:hypothetical protein